MDRADVKRTVQLAIEECLRPSEDMTLFAAQNLAKQVHKKAREMGVKAVIAISNKGANPVLVECSDDSLIGIYDIALNK